MTLKEQCKTLCEIIVVLFFNLLNFWTPKDDSFQNFVIHVSLMKMTANHHFLSLYLSAEKRLYFYFLFTISLFFGSCCRIFSLLWESLHFLSSNTQFRGQLGWTQYCHVHLLLKRLHGSIAIFQVQKLSLLEMLKLVNAHFSELKSVFIPTYKQSGFQYANYYLLIFSNINKLS